MARSAPYSGQVDLLTTVPGIGWLTALTLLVEIVDFSRFPDGEALSSFAGLTPSEYSSGDRVRHGRITRQGNPILRAALVESSWILIGKDPEMRRFYERIKIRRGGKKAIVAVARKLCHRLLAITKQGQPYRVNEIRKERTQTSPGDRDSPRTAATAWSVVTARRSEYMMRHRTGPEQATCGYDHE
jgi:transposase